MLNLLVAMISGLAGLYLLELVLVFIDHRAAAVQPDREPAAQIFSQAVLDLRAAGRSAYPVRVPYSFLQSLDEPTGPDSDAVVPLGSIASVVTVWCLRPDTEEWVVAPADEHGFHNPAGIWPGPIDVMLIGDSYAMGHCVERDETIGGRLRRLGAPRTLSLGLSINGPLLELATMAEFARPAEPRLIYWLYAEENDLQNLEVEWRWPLLHRYLEEPDFTQQLIDRQAEADSALTRHAEAALARFAERGGVATARPAPRAVGPEPLLLRIRRFATVGRIRGRLGLYRREAPQPAASPDQLARVVGRAAQMAKAWGGELVFVYLPSLARYTGPRFGRDDRQRAEVLEAIARLGIPILDVHRSFADTPDPVDMFVARPNGTRGVHYGPAGYDRVAGLISADLRSR